MYRCGANVNAGHIRFNWNRYIDYADNLLNSMFDDEDDEVKDRCGISRAYYGAFHRAQAYLNKIGITVDVNNRGSHNRVIEQFKGIGKANRLWFGIGLDLERLKNQRKKADYDDKYFAPAEKNSILKKQLEMAILKARSVVDKINNIEEQESNR